tara:strand:+ start:144 stop:731 length:588 start_codon:yes stop_codon:yes gene_type:complete
MKPIPTKYKGINFRSRLEARWYIFMKSLGWNIEYEPHIEELNNWLPDFLIIGKNTKVLVEVKPFSNHKDFYSDYAESTVEKIRKSNCFKRKDPSSPLINAVLIVGSSLNIGEASCGDSFMGGRIVRELDELECIEDDFVYTDHSGKIGVCDNEISYHDPINDDHDGGYCLRDENKEMLELCWNKAGSQLQWMPRC